MAVAAVGPTRRFFLGGGEGYHLKSRIVLVPRGRPAALVLGQLRSRSDVGVRLDRALV